MGTVHVMLDPGKLHISNISLRYYIIVMEIPLPYIWKHLKTKSKLVKLKENNFFKHYMTTIIPRITLANCQDYRSNQVKDQMELAIYNLNLHCVNLHVKSMSTKSWGQTTGSPNCMASKHGTSRDLVTILQCYFWQAMWWSYTHTHTGVSYT